MGSGEGLGRRTIAMFARERIHVIGGSFLRTYPFSCTGSTLTEVLPSSLNWVLKTCPTSYTMRTSEKG